MNEIIKLYGLVTYLEGNHADIYYIGVAPELLSILKERYRYHPVEIKTNDYYYADITFEHKTIHYSMKYYTENDWLKDNYTLFINGTKTSLSLEEIFNGTDSAK